MNEVEERAARAALERLRGSRAAARATFATLEGGLNRSSYVVSVDREQWVLQLAPKVPGLLDAGEEAAVLRAAAAAGVAPRVVAADSEHGLLLTEYRSQARPWDAADARATRNIARIGALLRTLHGVSATVPSYRAERFARGYLDALAASPAAAHFDERLRAWADELLDLARRYDAAHAQAALCHNDLFAANVLDDGDLVLVDFEYAVRSAPVLDLAGLAAFNDYGTSECRELLDAYYGEVGTRAPLAELADTVRMVRLVAFFWARGGALRAEDSDSYAELAAELERKLR